MRPLFEKAVAATGGDFKSNKLWDMYIDWEQELGHLENVLQVEQCH